VGVIPLFKSCENKILEILIPGFKKLHLSYLVLDYNGTLAYDGKLLTGVRERLEHLGRLLQVYILTADTFGTVQVQLVGIPCQVVIISRENQAKAKLRYVEKLGGDSVVCIGNGRNDRLMLQAAALGIAVSQEEGAAPVTIMAADVVTSSIIAALDLLINPLRLTATLRD
jgi:soluble P-type ATPase